MFGRADTNVSLPYVTLKIQMHEKSWNLTERLAAIRSLSRKCICNNDHVTL